MLVYHILKSQLVEKRWVLDKNIINESTGFEKAYMRVKGIYKTTMWHGSESEPTFLPE